MIHAHFYFNSHHYYFDAPIASLIALTPNEVAHCLQRADAYRVAGYWVAGYVAYEAAQGLSPQYASKFAIHSLPAEPLVYLAVFQSPNSSVAQHTPSTKEAVPALQWHTADDAARYAEVIDQIHAAIAAGETYQVNYTQCHQASVTLPAEYSDPEVIHALIGAWFAQWRETQQAPYCAWLSLPAVGGMTAPWHIVSLSPELFFATDGATITTQPMKGTIQRGRFAAEDQALAQQLQQDAKNRAENVMIVDLLRNDVAQIAQAGTVKVSDLFQVTAYPTLWQMTSTIRAQLRPNIGLLDIFAALFPCGSIVGAPKLQTSQVIARLEQQPRGVYCGAIGFAAPVSANDAGHMTFNVAIRTVVLTQSTQIQSDAIDGASSTPKLHLRLGLGSGVTWDSANAAEWDEILLKRQFVERQPRPSFELLETLRLSVDDRGAVTWHHLDAHLQRMQQSAVYFGFDFDALAIASRCADFAQHYAEPSRAGDWRVRLTLNQRGELHCAATSLKPLAAVLSVRVVDDLAHRVEKNNIFLHHKTTHRQVYQPWESQLTDDTDYLLVNQAGYCTELIRGNLVYQLVGDSQHYTPPQTDGLLGGILRQMLLADGVLQERTLSVNESHNLAQAWSINSLRGWMQIKF